MDFEKIELYGFKSFADKAEIKFGNGITAIVGPNGCGKSNVADAIRWVLGEQSAKTLRGSTMQDVIFAGTQGRKSLSYCEVSLFFDNSKKIFSVDYNEVIITRKLFRSGESEYYINKQPARLKDIVDLLHECGIGKEGYSIIGQGKVEEIMSAKPIDRRMIFEEATGISMFKTRKNESERKLERTRENLVRYMDIITEIENQLGPLERQAEKAKEFNELSENLKFHELNVYVAKVEGVAQAKDKIKKRIDGINEEIALRQNELIKAQKEQDEIFAKTNKADSDLKALNEELTEKRVGIEKSTGARRLFEQRMAYLASEIERAEREYGENEKLIASYKAEILSGEEEKEKLNAELETLSKQAEEYSKKVMFLTEKISLGEELASESRKKIIETIESLSDIKVEKGAISIEKRSLTEKRNELSGRLDALSFKREGLFNDKEKYDKDIDDLDRKVFDLKTRITLKEEEVRNGNEEVAKTENAIVTVNSAITTLVTRGSFYKSLKENYEGYSTSVRNLFKRSKTDAELKGKIRGVVAELIKSDKKYDVALETALAAAAQNIVTSTTDDAAYIIKYLKKYELGRVTCLPINSVKPRVRLREVDSALNEVGALGVADELVDFDKEFTNVISNLLGNTLIVDTLDNANFIAKKYGFAFKIVTLDGDLLSNQGSMTGGSRRTDTIGLLSNDRKIEDNEKALRSKEKEAETLRAEKKTLEEKRDKSLDELNVLNDLYNEERQQIVLVREKQAAAEKSLSELGREIESVTDLIEEVDARLSEIDKTYKSVTTGSEKAEAERDSAQSSANERQAEYDALRKERDELSALVTENQVRTTELKSMISALSQDRERLISSVADAEKQNAEIIKSNDGARAMIEELKREQEKVALTKEEQEVVNEIRAKIEGIDREKEELRAKLESNEAQKNGISERINELSERKHAEEISMTKIDSDLEYLGQSIFEDYQETYETAAEKRAENYDAKAGEQEVIRIRRKRSALGAINANAIDEFKVLKERYEEMTTQRDDLIKAEDDLKVAIDKIKGEMQAQFDAGFKKINENFQRIFKELFGGGKAMLQMDYTDVDDKLEAGVEIVAEPPGKKLQKLSLLSGGEKALTAIAILFAILRLRPMPFCVLDEIEAALDEANVDRFAEYLQKFSKETQFIVITHRKPTMERADALFGVTMQEKGVSKMVSVKLSDAAAFDAGTAV